MLSIKDTADLRKYLEVRKELASKQATSFNKTTNTVANAHIRGMLFAFDEAIKAVEALQQAEQTRSESFPA